MIKKTYNFSKYIKSTVTLIFTSSLTILGLNIIVSEFTFCFLFERLFTKLEFFMRYQPAAGGVPAVSNKKGSRARVAIERVTFWSSRSGQVYKSQPDLDSRGWNGE